MCAGSIVSMAASHPRPAIDFGAGEAGSRGGVAYSPQPQEMSALVRHTLVVHAYLRHVASGPFFRRSLGRAGDG